MPECKEKSTARLDTLRAFLTRQAGIFCQKHRRKADCQHTLLFAFGLFDVLQIRVGLAPALLRRFAQPVFGLLQIFRQGQETVFVGQAQNQAAVGVARFGGEVPLRRMGLVHRVSSSRGADFAQLASLISRLVSETDLPTIPVKPLAAA